MSPSRASSDAPSPAEPPESKPRDDSGGLAAPRSNEAGSGNTLGDGRTAGGGDNAARRDELDEPDDPSGRPSGTSHGDAR